MKKTILCTVVLLSFSITSCNSQNKSNTDSNALEANVTQKSTTMKSHISIFEIPATNISRAVNFYQTILDLNIETMEMPGMAMGIFP